MTERWFAGRPLGVLLVVVLVVSGTIVVEPVRANGSDIQSGTIDTFGSNAWAFNDMAQNSSGTIHQVNIDENDRITVRAWDGSAWSVVTSFTAGEVTDVTVDSLSNDLSLDIDAQDHLHLTYRGSIGSGVDNTRGVLYGEYDGSSWTHSWVESATHPNGWNNFDDPLLVVEDDGTPHLQYEFSGESTNDIRYATPDGAGGWTIETIVSTDGSGTDEVFTGAVDVDSTGTVHMWYTREDDQNTYTGNVYHTTRPSGGSWSSPTKLLDSTGDGIDYDFGGALVADGDQHLVYSYTEWDTDWNVVNSEIRHVSDETGSMQDTLVDQSTSRSLVALGVATTTQGAHDVYVMADSSNADWTVVHQQFYGRNADDQWVDGTDLSFTSNSIGEMVFEVNPSGELVTVTEGTNLRNVYYKAGPVSAFVPVPNDPPAFDTASPTLSVDEDSGATSIDSLLTATDTEGGSTLTWSVASTPSNGTLGGFDATASTGTGVAPSGLTYTPDPDFFGSDSFDVQVADGLGGTDTVTVDVTVSGVGDVPVAGDETLTTDEDTEGSITLPAVDADGDSLTYAVTAQPTDGVVTVDGTTLTYDPDADFVGSNVFSYRVDDGTDGTDTGDVSVTVSATNDPPVATATSLTTDEEVTAEVDVSATDVDGDTLTYSVAAQAADGWVYNTDNTFTYVPDTDFFGTDAFTYEVDDGNGGTDTATVSVTVTNVNDAPVAPDDGLTTDEDTPGTLAGPATDVDGDDLTYTVHTSPSNGSVSVADGTFTFTPDADFTGSDAFTYEVDDGNGGTDTGTVSVTVAAVNDAPVAGDDDYTTAEDTTLTVSTPGVLGNDADVDADSLTATVTDSPTNGSLSLAADGSFDYTPDADFFGTDAFTYEVDDGNGGTDTGTVSVTVTGVNDAPAATGDSYTTDEDTALSVSTPGVLGNDADVDADSLTATVTGSPTNGSLTLAADGSFDYTPDADFFGTDAFTYEVDDRNGETDTGSVSITVAAVNDAPTVADDEYTTDEDTTLTVDVAGGVLANDTDVEGEGLTASVVSGPSNGTLTLFTDGSFTYDPDTDFAGADSFTYEARDDTGATTGGTVTVTVAVVADAPRLSNLDGTTVTYTEDGMPVELDTAPHVTVTDPDPDGSRTTGTLVASVTANGTAEEDVLALNTSGPVSLSAGTTAGSTVGVSGTTVGTVRAGETGADGEPFGVDFEPGITDAQVESLLRAITYENVNADAPDTRSRTVTVTVTDAGGSDTATVTVPVVATNDAPTVAADHYSMNEDESLSVPAPGVLSNDTDADGDTLAVNTTAGAAPTNGTLTRFANGSFVYTPNPDFAGTDSFVYEVADGNGGTDTGTVTVVVTDVPEPRGSSEEETTAGRVLLSTSSPIDSVTGRATFGAASDSVESVQVEFAGHARGRWRTSQLERPPAESNYAGDEEDVVASLDITVPPNVENRPAVITMTIHESRVDSMGVTSDQLVVDHYDEPTDTWTRLDSRVVGTANGYVTLEVQTPHFSLFVIAADRSVASPSTAGPTRPTTPDATDGSGDSAGEDGPLDDVVSDLVDAEPVPDVDVDVDAAEVAPETVPGPDETVGAAVVALLLALVAVGVGLRRR
ncbi:Ig-like domain-containing protein [Salinigranum halophilum]|uniref:Ig-like domain-containing protein n=1 Tax=Salinigranum halophilum TaxID=2565931 RepID=UPI00115DFDA5|nr:tandem-95 repeat protein [Salinigranum halophilum]